MCLCGGAEWGGRASPPWAGVTGAAGDVCWFAAAPGGTHTRLVARRDDGLPTSGALFGWAGGTGLMAGSLGPPPPMPWPACSIPPPETTQNGLVFKCQTSLVCLQLQCVFAVAMSRAHQLAYGACRIVRHHQIRMGRACSSGAAKSAFTVEGECSTKQWMRCVAGPRWHTAGPAAVLVIGGTRPKMGRSCSCFARFGTHQITSRYQMPLSGSEVRQGQLLRVRSQHLNSGSPTTHPPPPLLCRARRRHLSACVVVPDQP